jgi:hypothetical protein
MKKLDEASQKKNSNLFMESTPEQRKSLLIDLDKEAKELRKTKKRKIQITIFSAFKQLTLWGYFTSEPGATKALRLCGGSRQVRRLYTLQKR